MGGTVIPTYLAADEGWTPPDAASALAGAPAATPVAAPVAAAPQPMDPNNPQTIEQQPTSYNGMTTDDAANHAAAVHHGRLATMLDAVGSILGGNKSLRMTRNPDGSVDVKQVDASPAEKWGRIAQAAVSGLANGFAVGQGPGGGARAAAAGIQTGLAEPGQQQTAVMDQAAKLNQQNQQNQLFKANMIALNQRNLQGAFDLKRAEANSLEGEDDRAATIQKTMQQANATKIDVGDIEDTANAYNGSPELQEAHHDGRTVFYRRTDPNTGKVIGGSIYIIPPDQMNMLNPAAITRHRLVINPQDPLAAPTWDTSQVITAKSTPMGKVAAMQQADEDTSNKLMLDWQARSTAASEAKTRDRAARAAEISAGAAATEAGAHAHLYNVQADLAPRALDIKDQSLQNKNTFDFVKKQVFPLNNNTEKSWQLADNAYNEWANARRQGKTLPTGAQAMTEFSQHIANTFGGVKGVRINKDLIQEHLGARSVPDDALVAFQRLTNGDPLSPNQWNAFHGLIKQARDASWQGVAANARAAGIPASPDWFPQDLQGLATGDLPAKIPSGAAVAGGVTLPPRPANHTAKASYVQSGNNYYWIEPENLDAAKAADRNLKVIGQ